ncbi:hypothetical protein IQ22_04361 [Pseudomonas duriflava]|uniref:Uncharacterized protein n=1 Tax=Pseudomonas duriflava TaxID=459528 RepID=A0A562PRQ0_9PSED|nr:hypothetical protein [Pseudomonas duriflava]TWI47089.1 hypothetical protein IQ22_04361 [Pseudomonas duriflava]
MRTVEESQMYLAQLREEQQKQHAEFLKQCERASTLSWKEIALVVGSLSGTAVLTLTVLHVLECTC